MTPAQIEFYKRLAHGLALQFGPNCEVVVHDLETDDVDHSIVVIENGHVSGRKLGDGPSHIVFESMHEGATDVRDREPYLTKTTDGKLLKSSTIFIRNDEGKPVGILGINFDITLMKAFERSLDALQEDIVKAQLVTDQPLPEGLTILHQSQLGRIQTLILRGKQDDIAAKLALCHPMLCDLLPLSLEEIFIYELGGVDYDVKNILL